MLTYHLFARRSATCAGVVLNVSGPMVPVVPPVKLKVETNRTVNTDRSVIVNVRSDYI